MTLRGKKSILIIGSAFLWIAAAGVLAWGIRPPELPVKSHSAAEFDRSREKAANHPAAISLSSKDFEAYWDRPLRPPLFDPPPPPPPVVEKKPIPPVRAKLLATMIEAGNSMAMLELENGEVVFRKVGELIGPPNSEAKVAEIQPGTVIVRQGEDETRLTVD